MKTLLAATVSAVLLASGTVAFAETPSANAPKIEAKTADKAAAKASAPSVSVKIKGTKVEEKGKTVQLAQEKGKSAESKGKAETKGVSAEKGKADTKAEPKAKAEEKGKK